MTSDESQQAQDVVLGMFVASSHPVTFYHRGFGSIFSDRGVTHRSHRIQKQKFSITCPGVLFMESMPFPPNDEK
jgi:hypothetical protein